MTIRMRIKRRSFVRKHWALSLLAATAMMVFFSLVLREAVRNQAAVPSKMPIRATRSIKSIERPQVIPADYKRAIYPYSVIRGGVRSRAELETNIASDPVVASHYAKFKVGEAKLIRSSEMPAVHVSYRMGDKVYWTAKTVKIPAGETLVSDGKNVARARCGNQVSVLPQEPVSEEEPPVDSFDVATYEPVQVASMEPPPLDTPSAPQLGVPLQLESALEPRPIEPLIPYVPVVPAQTPRFGNLRYDSEKPLMVVTQTYKVPETGATILLMLGGVGVFFAARLLRKQ